MIFSDLDRIFCEVRIVMSMKRKLYIFIHVSIKNVVFEWLIYNINYYYKIIFVTKFYKFNNI